MSIWFNKNLSVEALYPMGKGSLGEHLGMEWVELGDDFLKMRMPVDARTRQPYGLLHGGASVALSETVGSVASAMVVDHERFFCVGIEINANHLRAVREGFVTAVARPLHLGGQTHVWDVRIYDEKEKLICVSRLTVAIQRRDMASAPLAGRESL